ncbi:unnamed protein product [Allacma fusca]|uniref:Amino acid transporter transmembrane domain-containing protein n=1 Tax=Allacma fusca TaxID=39272 RepID=A0A8J2PG89_9HEXA|nr:unnamed protein product [Allacma fusca]
MFRRFSKLSWWKIELNDDTLTGLVYVFNLIVGTGALTLPKAFSTTGWALGLVVILILAFMSYLTVTLVIEAMSIANALIVKSRRDRSSTDSSLDEPDGIGPTGFGRERERDPLIPPELGEHHAHLRRQANTAANFEIKERVEMGSMASMFFGKIGVYLFYLCIAIYLYGDLSIYIAAVSKSVRDVACSYTPNSTDVNSTNLLPNDSDPCWTFVYPIDRFFAYRIFSIIFMLVLGPFVFFNVQKTKYLQLTTTFMRWLAFIIMIGFSILKIASSDNVPKNLPLANYQQLPNLFGVCVYSFMCHHSLPSLVTPISSKRRLFGLFFADYTLITIFYLLLAFTGIFAFTNLEDLYTLNFKKDSYFAEDPYFIIIFVTDYFLPLFPVFTLSTNFPIIAITLKNNLKALFQIHDDIEDENNSLIMSIRYGKWKQFWTNLGFPLLAITPPFLIAIFVEDLQVLVSATGSYAGAGIQYVIPVCLVYYARKCFSSPSVINTNPYASPFKTLNNFSFYYCCQDLFVLVSR